MAFAPVAQGQTAADFYKGKTVSILIGFPPAMVFFCAALNLVYQFWIHTERIGKLWRPFEFIFNTPSHHRVHHGTNSEYLDRNHGSILIVWDKLFGTFEAENAQPVYGLTTDIDTFNPLRIAGHEWADTFADVSSADNWADRWSYLLRGPGWAYDKRKARLAA